MQVQVYWNLNKDIWSVRCAKTKKVIEYRETLTLTDCTFTVQKGGRETVRKNKVKHVHAWVKGTLATTVKRPTSERVRYNPYETDTFVYAATGKEITAAASLTFTKTGQVYL